MIAPKTKKNLALIALTFILNLIVLPAFADQVILEQLAQSDTEQLDINLPADLEPGYHQMIVEVLEEENVITSKIAYFCKTLEGEIRLDNICGDIPQIASQAQLEKIVVRAELPGYEGALEPKKTQSTLVAIFSLLGAIGTGAAQGRDNSNDDEDEESQDDLASVSGGKLRNRDGEGVGDRRAYTKNRFFTTLDDLAIELGLVFEHFSSLMARVVNDARYLRAAFGTYAWALPLLAIFFVLQGLNQYGSSAMPFLPATVIAIMAIGIFDAWAGFYASIAYILAVIAAGGISDRSAFMTVIGTSLIFFAPALLASEIRPFQRTVRDSESRWERITDYALASLLGGWAVSKLVLALPILARKQVLLTFYAEEIGIIAGVLIILRLALEDYIWYLYPARLERVTYKEPEDNRWHDIRRLIFKTYLFYVLAAPFVSHHSVLLLATVVFLIPQLLKFVSDRLPKSKLIAKILPNGAFKLVIMAIIGTLYAKYLSLAIENTRDLISYSMVFLALPSFIFSLLSAVADESVETFAEKERNRLFYRFGGVAIFIVIVLMVRGLDFASLFS